MTNNKQQPDTRVFHFAAQTGAYLGESNAEIDPIDNVPLVPANATLTAPPSAKDGQVACFVDGAWEVKADQRGTTYWTADGTKVTITDIGASKPTDALDTPPPPSREEQRAAALTKVDAEHARALRDLTGGATIEERDTWKTKEEAARAMIELEATPGQSAMIELEAAAKGLSAEDLAQAIMAKAEAYQQLIGLAAALKAEAKTAVTAATSDDVPLDDVAAGLQAVFVTMKEKIDQAVEAWKEGAG